MQNLVAGIDSSTQSCKVMVRDAETGQLVRSGVARHASGTEIDPMVWWHALQAAINEAGGLDDVQAVSIAGQQHGMIALDEKGEVVRDALLWNDTRSGQAADDLVIERGNGSLSKGRAWWADRIGVVPVASFTASKIRWLAENEPENYRRTVAIALPHDWLCWKLRGCQDISDLVTDRSEASGTGYFNSETNSYDSEILRQISPGAESLLLPRIAEENEIVGSASALGSSAIIGPGMGDNAGAAFGLDVQLNEPIISIGTSGVVTQVLGSQTHDSAGLVAGFADATGNFLPLVATLNASRVIDAYASLLNVQHDEFARLALSAPPGAEGLVCVPYLEGERTPNFPNAKGALHGISLKNFTKENVARAVVEGMLCGVGEGIEALRAVGASPKFIRLIGGGAQSEAVRQIAASVYGIPVVVPQHGEYVADGAARQAAWALSEEKETPKWLPRLESRYEKNHQPVVREQYEAAKNLFVSE
ncbi:xylulokinase [Corynebacterium glucuronolyticum]|uniref:xylulokinase n=1 Tax=Corynebacterium glucuronolyticum TaxID=39791 RepID=UPI0021AF1DD4|nr:xylulokinase [Corynebacterium glucuronolyticum]MCT1443290.1 xylulokinase [Corynebacterium glucuronolyticum]